MSRRPVLLSLVFLGILISYVDRGNLGIAAPALMSEFHFPPGTMGVLLSAFFWTYAVFQLPAGLMVDRFGIRWTYAAAFLLWSISSAAIAWSRSFGDILVLRMLLGVAETVGPIASLTFIRKSFSGREQGFPTSVYIAGQTFGPAVGTLLGTALLAHYGWRFMFAATGLGALLWIPFWAGLASERHTQPIASNAAEPPPNSKYWTRCFKEPVFWALAACVFFLSYFWYFVLTWVPTYLVASRGLSTSAMGRVLSTPLFAMAFANLACGALADRLTTRNASIFAVRGSFLAGGLLGASSLLLLNFLPELRFVLPVLIFAICSFGVASSSFWTIAQHVSPSATVARTIATLNTVSQIAGAAAPVITGWTLGPKKHFGLAIALAGASPVVAACLLLIANPTALQRFKERLSISPAAPVVSI